MWFPWQKMAENSSAMVAVSMAGGVEESGAAPAGGGAPLAVQRGRGKRSREPLAMRPANEAVSVAKRTRAATAVCSLVRAPHCELTVSL